MQQVSVLETNIGSSTTGNSANQQIIFNDSGVLRGDTDLTFNTALNLLTVTNLAVSAAATITGNLTVDTNTLFVDSANDRVGVGTATPLFPLDIISSGATTVAVRSTGAVGLFRGYAITDGTTEYGQFKQNFSTGELQIVSGNSGWGGLFTVSTGGSERYRLASDGVATWSNVGGVAGTAMTLNSTGLGVGVAPSYKLDVQGSDNSIIAQFGGTSRKVNFTTSANGGFANGFFNFVSTSSVGAFSFQNTNGTHLIIDSTGNFGIGVTPSAWGGSFKAIQVGSQPVFASSSANNVLIASNWHNDGTDKYVATGASSRFVTGAGFFYWQTAPSGTAGNAITFTERLRLKETGQLRFVPLAADPAGAEAGDVYYNSTSNKLKCYNGTTWNDLF